MLFSDTTIATSGGNITFNGRVDGAEVDFGENLTLSSGSGAIAFNDLVGGFVALGVVDATGSSSLTAVDTEENSIPLISSFLRLAGTTPLPAAFNALQLLPEFVIEPPDDEPPDENVTIPPPDTGGPNPTDGTPLQLIDVTPSPSSLQSLLSLAALAEIAPGAGTEGDSEAEGIVISEADAEAIAEALEFVVESCPDVILTSLSWQNTPADAAFNMNPMLVPYSVDEFCAGHTLTVPGRGSAEAYQGLTFVRRDFWTDLKQSRDEEVIAEIRGDFGLPERESN